MEGDDLRILIVEDDPIIATDIRSLLIHEGLFVVGVAKNAIRAFDMLHSLNPNFAILDIHLGAGSTGIDVAETIHHKYQFPYIFLTSFSDPDTLAAARDQGPFGYLVKPFQDQTLLATINIAWSNFNRVKQSTANLHSDRLAPLTKQEQSICEYLIKGLSYKQICDALNISVNTLKYHVKSIYLKLDVTGRAELTAMFLK